MKRLFQSSIRKGDFSKFEKRFFNLKNQFNQGINDKLLNLNTNIPDKIVSYDKKLEDIFSSVCYMHKNSNFFRRVIYRFFKSIEDYNIKYRKEEIGDLIFSHTTSKRYYIINGLFLGLYVLYAYHINQTMDLPSSIKNTSYGFALASSIGLILMFYYSKRHVKYLYLVKNSKNFEIETYHCLGLLHRKHTIPVNELKQVVGVNANKKTGIFSLIFMNSLGKKRNFYFRPNEIHNNELFDIYIKRKYET